MEEILNVMDWFIICAGLVLTLVGTFTFVSLIDINHAAPVYIINLLISDLIQFSCLATLKAAENTFWYMFLEVSFFIYIHAVTASAGFRLFIALERYSVIARPLWHKFREDLAIPEAVSVVLWILPLSLNLLLFLGFFPFVGIFFVFFLIPLFVFFLVVAIRGPSAAHGVSAEEKRRTVAILVLVLIIYTVMFLPSIVWLFMKALRKDYSAYRHAYLLAYHRSYLPYYLVFREMTLIPLSYAPFADLTLFIFIRKGVIDELLVSLCCKMGGSRGISSTDGDDTPAPGTQTA